MRLVLAGEGPEKQALQHAAQATGYAEHILFTGPTNRAWEAFCGFDVFLTQLNPLKLFAEPLVQDGSPRPVSGNWGRAPLRNRTIAGTRASRMWWRGKPPPPRTRWRWWQVTRR